MAETYEEAAARRVALVEDLTNQAQTLREEDYAELAIVVLRQQSHKDLTIIAASAIAERAQLLLRGDT